MAYTNQLGTLDWVSLGVVVGVSLLISVVSAIATRKQRNLADFLQGGRNLNMLPTAISLFASVQSSILILGFPADSYFHGFHFWSTIGGHLLASWLTLLFVVPWLYPLQAASMYTYFRKRLGSYTVQVVASIIGITYQLIYAGVCILGPATALEALSGFAAWKSVLIIGLVSTVPTAISGLRGVIWMDLFQAVVMLSLMLTVLVLGSREAGGASEAWKLYHEHHKELQLTKTESWGFWPALIGGIISWFGHFGLSQPGYQRYSSMSSLNRARGVVLFAILLLTFGFVVAGTTGVVMFGYVRRHLCTTSLFQVKSPNHLMPLFLTELVAREGIAGLFIAALFCGGFSSVTSSLSAISANAWEDMFVRCLGQKKDTIKDVTVRIIVLVGGIAATGLAYAMLYVPGSIFSLILAMINSVLIPLVGIFLAAGMFKFVNRLACFVAVLLSLAFNLWMSVGNYVHGPSRTFSLPGNLTTCNVTIAPASNTTSTEVFPLYTISYQWYGLIGLATSIGLSLLLSACSRPCAEEKVNDELFLQCFKHRCKRVQKLEAYSQYDN